MNTPEIDLSKFCAALDDRPSLAQPFSHGDFTYATDGKIMIRVAKCYDKPNANHAPLQELVEPLLACANTATEWISLPTDIPEIEYAACDKCAGVGRFLKCKKCRGEGFVECCECGHEKDCRECNGTGKHPTTDGADICKDCSGSGKLEQHPPIGIGDSRINSKFVRLIATLPGVAISPYALGGSGQIPFRFSGGIGAVMPLRKL